MSVRTYFLAAAAATVVVGGVYLWLEVRGSDAAAPSPEAVAEAQARHARATAGDRVAGRQVRPPRPGGDDPLEAPIKGLPRPRASLPMNDAFDRPPSPQVPDRAGGLQAPIDPDDPERASAMTEANKAYDRGDYDGARTMAYKLLEQDPGNVRMLRVVVSASCILGDADVATQHWQKLPPPDQSQMAVRCSRYQVTFPGTTAPLEK